MIAEYPQCIDHLKNGIWKRLQGEHNKIEIGALMAALDVESAERGMDSGQRYWTPRKRLKRSRP
ncbi:MAG: hypothetical protein LBT01_00720 [Spirochaetaceae bacterium]|nr:hypothetical protein [Spirochaetaceae bacterium]